MEWKTEEEFKVHEAAPPLHLVRSQEDGLGLDYIRGPVLSWQIFFFNQFGRTILQGIFREKLLGLPLCAMG